MYDRIVILPMITVRMCVEFTFLVINFSESWRRANTRNVDLSFLSLEYQHLAKCLRKNIHQIRILRRWSPNCNRKWRILKKEDKNSDRREHNTTTRSCVYNRQDTPRSPRRGHRSPQRRPEERKSGSKRPHQDSRPKTNENRRFTRGSTRGAPGIPTQQEESGNNPKQQRPLVQQQEQPQQQTTLREKAGTGYTRTIWERNFPQMVKLINRAVSIRHHTRNWLNLPEKLSKQMDEFIEGIRPPAPNEELRTDSTLSPKNTKMKSRKQYEIIWVWLSTKQERNWVKWKNWTSTGPKRQHQNKSSCTSATKSAGKTYNTGLNWRLTWSAHIRASRS